jgi:hypothetical protein
MHRGLFLFVLLCFVLYLSHSLFFRRICIEQRLCLFAMVVVKIEYL